MHDTAIAAVIFTYSAVVADSSLAVNISSIGILGIIIVPVILIVVALLTSLVGRLRKQRAVLNELFEQAPQAVALMSADYRVVRVNPEFTRLFGYDQKEVIGRDIRELIIGDESEEEAQKFIDMTERGQRVVVEGVRRRKDGTLLYVSIVHVPVSLPDYQIARYAIYRDVTERERAEESLKLFRSLIDQTSDAIEAVDPDTLRFLDCNKSAYQALGYTREEFLSLYVRDIDPTIDASRFSQLNEEIEKSGFATFESLHRRKDGSLFPVEINVKAVRLERDYLVAVVRDITERKRAEEALRLSEERFAKAFHTNPEPISIIRYSDSIILEINNRWESVFGYTRKEAIGRTAEELNLYVNPNDRLNLRDIFKEQGFLREQEAACLSKSGDVRHISMSAEPIVINDEPCIIFLMRDITERKRAEEALRQAEEKYRSIFENAVEGIFQTTPDGHFITANPALARMLGYGSPEELLSSRTDIAHQHYVEPEDRAEFKRLLEAHGVVREFERQAYRKDTSKIWLSESVRVVRDERGAVLYYEGFTEDITERKQAEQRLREYEKVVEGLDEMIVVVDRDYRYLLANHAFLTYRGMEREQLVGRLVSEVLNPGVFENVVKEKLDQCFAGNVVRYEMRYNYPEVGERDIFISYFPVEGSAGIERAVCVLKDITETRRAEQALKESQRRLEEAQRIAHLGYWERDLETGLITWSDEIYRILGLPPQENDSPPTEWRHMIHPEDRERVSVVTEEAQRGVRRYDLEYRIVRPDGEVRFLHSQGDIIRDEHGRARRAFGIAQDITERKRAEALLHAKEQEFRAIVENAPDHIARYDRSLRRTYVNPAFAEALGLPGEALIDKPIFSSLRDAGADVKEDELTQIRQRIKGVFVTGESCEFEVTVPMPSGGRYYSVRCFPELDLNGSVINVLAIARDITERKQAEDALRRSEDRTRLIIDTIPTMTWSLGTDGVVDFLNRRWMDYTGISLEQYVKEPTRPVHPEDIPRVTEKWRADMAAGELNEDEIRLRRADGEYRWFLVRNAPLRDEQGNVVKWYGASIDIEDRKQAEEKLKQSESQLVEAQHLAHVGSWNWDLRSNAVIWSDELYRIFGLQPGEIKVAGDAMPFIHPEDRDLVFSIVKSSVKNKEPYNFYYRVLRPDGDERIVYSHGRIVLDEDGEPIKAFGATQDVTELKRAEEKLRATSEQLRALSARVQAAKEREGTRIAREIHDELGAALTSLKWDLESFDKIISESVDGSQFQVLRERIKSMLRLTESTISSVRRISSELRPSVLDDLGLAEAIEWQAEQFQVRTGIICRYDCSMEGVDLSREQSTAVFRILQEALTNVLRHARATSVDVTLKAEAGEFVLKVIDNGRGITENERSGTQSLGLLGMQERAHLIGGEINVTGVEGEGTVITVRVPFSD